MTLKPCGTITLYRHGKVAFDDWQWATAGQFRALVTAYNSQLIRLRHDLAREVVPEIIVASTLSRSRQSAEALFGRYDIALDMFREAELPDMPALPFRLPAVRG